VGRFPADRPPGAPGARAIEAAGIVPFPARRDYHSRPDPIPAARRAATASRPAQEGRPIACRRLGRILILLGVLAWAPYALLRYLLELEVPLWPFLTVHLLGVVPGSILSRWEQIRALIGSRKPGGASGPGQG
jgi:hypothetical protein